MICFKIPVDLSLALKVVVGFAGRKVNLGLGWSLLIVAVCYKMQAY